MKLTDSTAAITSKSPSVAAEAPRSQSLSLAELLRKFGWQGGLAHRDDRTLRAGARKASEAMVDRCQLLPRPSGTVAFGLPHLATPRQAWRRSYRKPSNWGLLVVFGSLGLLFPGSLGPELFLTRISIIGTVCGLIVYFAGWKLLWAMAFPLIFLLFAIPIPVIIYDKRSELILHNDR